MIRCVAEPEPADEKLSAPGFDRAIAKNSCRLFALTLSPTTSTLAVWAIMPTGVKSAIGSYFIFRTAGLVLWVAT